MSETVVAYKGLRVGGAAPYTGFEWPLPRGKRPGKWVEIDGEPKLCARGFHGFLTRAAAESAGAEVYEVEITGRLVRDNEKIAGTKARLLRRIDTNIPELTERGIRNCLDCGQPHDRYRRGALNTWEALSDGHSYRPEGWESYALRVTGMADRVQAAIGERRIAQSAYDRKGTYTPVVPAYHAFKGWPEFPDRCGTCGLDEGLHDGWEARAELADRFRGYDRWELLLVIQSLEAA